MDSDTKKTLEDLAIVGAIGVAEQARCSAIFIMSQVTTFFVLRLSDCRTIEDYQKLTVEMSKAFPPQPQACEDASEALGEKNEN